MNRHQQFLANNFWMGFATQSQSIQQIIDSPTGTVDELLDDSDCLMEFKNRNEDLINYFDHERLATLIEYITVVADEKDGAQRGRKFPFLVDQIFGCEIE